MTETSADATAEFAAPAFDAARSGGVIDTFLAMPDTREKQAAKYDAGHYAAGLTLDRNFSELPDVGFRDHVWPQFLRENAARVFGLAPVAPPDPPT